jgi:hypothetical protein
MSIHTDIAVEAVLAGRIKTHNLLDHVKPNIPFSYKAASAKFMKVRPGEFKVVKMLDGEEFDTAVVSNPNEAKMEVIGYVVDSAKTA